MFRHVFDTEAVDSASLATTLWHYTNFNIIIVVVIIIIVLLPGLSAIGID